MIHFVGMETKENRNRLTGVVWWWHVYPPPPLSFIFFRLVSFPPPLQGWNENSWITYKLAAKFKKIRHCRRQKLTVQKMNGV